MKIHSFLWNNVLKSTEVNKLLELLELNILSSSDLESWNRIGFLNNVKQARFDVLMNKKIEVNLIETNAQKVFLINIDINGIVLFNKNKKLGSKKIEVITEHLKYLYNEALNLDNLDNFYQDINKLRLIAYDEETFKKAMIKKDAITHWLENSIDVFLKKVDSNISQSNSLILSIKEPMKELAEKIMFEYNLQQELNIKDSKKNRVKI